jgi:hypothetical protein
LAIDKANGSKRADVQVRAELAIRRVLRWLEVLAFASYVSASRRGPLVVLVAHVFHGPSARVSYAVMVMA